MKILYETVYGSQLYGTNTVDSDLDVKGVFAPYSYDILSGKEKVIDVKEIANKDKHEKSNKNTVEKSYYSLLQFFSMLNKGGTTSIEMLFVNNNDLILTNSDFFTNEILSNRDKFISKKIISFVNFSKANSKLLNNNVEQNKKNKVLYNCIRICTEAIELVETGKIVFPLYNSNCLKNIKIGNENFDEALKYLNTLTYYTEGLIKDSDLPDSPDLNFMQDLIIKYYKEYEDK